MSEKTPPERRLLYLLLGIVLFFLLIRIPPLFALMRSVLPVLVVAGLIYLGYRLLQYGRAQARRRAYERTTQGRIHRKLEQFRKSLQDNEAEMQEIRANIQELEQKVASTTGISDNYRRESGVLLAAFRSEHKLRQEKARFYESGVRKLQSLLNNLQLAEEIETKKERLRELRENHYEELARLEEMKSDLELDTTYLDTIEELSTRLLESRNVDDAEHLRLELEEMTRELDEL